MAPPLKANARFFVLTKMPMAVCPFCETEAEWPEDILAIYTKRRVKPVPFNVKIKTRGILALGALRDPETGFLSLRSPSPPADQAKPVCRTLNDILFQR